MSPGHTTAIDRLSNGEVTAAVLALVSAKAAEGFLKSLASDFSRPTLAHFEGSALTNERWKHLQNLNPMAGGPASDQIDFASATRHVHRPSGAHRKLGRPAFKRSGPRAKFGPLLAPDEPGSCPSCSSVKYAKPYIVSCSASRWPADAGFNISANFLP
jgi:hypothetical protein